jgi:NAD(P)H-dependent FMN reductase
MSTKKVLIFVGSVRDGRQGIKVANLILNQLRSQGVETSLIGKEPLHFSL